MVEGKLVYLFDLDRTVINSDAYIAKCIAETIKIMGGIDRRTSGSLGLSLEDFYMDVNPDGDPRKYCEIHRQVEETLDWEVMLFEDTFQTLETLRLQNIEFGLVTNRRSNSTKKFLAMKGIEKYFKVVITRDDVVKPKPHPQGILKAIVELAAYPQNVIMVGDSDEDVDAARFAGVTSVRVLYPSNTNAVVTAKSDYTISCLSDLIGLE
jgi:phosphoglycolate phosphatase